ncbi:TPA: DUF2090 domain-containing protein, partial [Mannheimia haemolytica]|nr:DUF2090 domain-containing protein [Mannheimia haemolytica]
IILPADMPQSEAFYNQAIAHFYQLGIKPEWWKLPDVSRAQWQAISATIEANDPDCRGILILGLDAPLEVFKDTFEQAKGCEKVKGFAVGRTIFGEPSEKWLAGELDDNTLISAVSEKYRTLIDLWQQR